MQLAPPWLWEDSLVPEHKDLLMAGSTLSLQSFLYFNHPASGSACRGWSHLCPPRP